MKLRHEYKHEVNAADLIILRQRLSTVMQLDPHAENGQYVIRSLYFDTPRDRALREKLDGVCNREKFRIRCYNNDFSHINLEKKVKRGELGFKRKAVLTAEQTQAIINGDIRWLAESDDELLREFYCKCTLDRLEPKTIVEYTREPYIYEPGNVRVTLDTNLHTGLRSTDFLNAGLPLVPVRPGIAVLEVKWDELLPESIKHAVDLRGRRTAPFSKYAMCRMFD